MRVASCDSSLRFVRAEHGAKAPLSSSSLAAGYDLFAAESAVLAPGGRSCVSTGLRITVPSGCYGRIAPRSGLALRYGLDVGAGVVDADFRGIVKVLLFNFGSEVFNIEVGDRIAQLILEKIFKVDTEEVSTLDDTSRGEGGFGSSGLVYPGFKDFALCRAKLVSF